MCEVFNNLTSATTWRHLDDRDYELYSHYFAQNVDPYLYENNWAFVCQESRLAAVRYCDGEMLLTMVAKDIESPNLIMFAPYGDQCRFSDQAPGLIHRVEDITGKRVIVRRAPPLLRESLLTTGFFETVPLASFTHARDIPEDVFPQVVIEVAKSLALRGSALQRIRNQINQLTKRHRVEFVMLGDIPMSAVQEIAVRWQQQHHERMLLQTCPSIGQADPSAYTILIDRFGRLVDNVNYFGRAIRIDGVLSGFALAARTTSVCASLYASLCLLGVRGAADAMMISVLQSLLDADIHYLNLGGAETEGLHRFKRKYCETALIPTFDLALRRSATSTERPELQSGSSGDISAENAQKMSLPEFRPSTT